MSASDRLHASKIAATLLVLTLAVVASGCKKKVPPPPPPPPAHDTSPPPTVARASVNSFTAEPSTLRAKRCDGAQASGKSR